MRASRLCAWWIKTTAWEEHSERLTSPQSPAMTPAEKMRWKRESAEMRRTTSSPAFLLLRIVFEHIWAHLFPHRKSPVQLTWAISCETKASVEEGRAGGGLLSGQVERQLFLCFFFPSLSYSLSLLYTWFCVTFLPPCRLLSRCLFLRAVTPRLSPAVPTTRADRDHYCHREHKCPKDSIRAPVRCLSFVFPCLPSFFISLLSRQPTLTKALTQ